MKPSKQEKQRQKKSRALGKQLVELANDDQWEACLNLLSLYNPNNEDAVIVTPWLGATTDDGDGLIHLAAFAACDFEVDNATEENESRSEEEDEDDSDDSDESDEGESDNEMRKKTDLPPQAVQKNNIICSSTDETIQQKALQCLEQIVSLDPFAVQRYSADGGTALHAALAAASSLLESAQTLPENQQQQQLQGEHLQNTNDNNLRNNHVSEVQQNATTILTTIKILLQAGANVNAPLMNVLRRTHNNNNNKDDDDDDEEDDKALDLCYSRESIVGQWTPLVMVLLWLGLLASSTTMNESTNVLFQLGLEMLQELLQAGADPLCPVGGGSSYGPLEFALCLSFLLSRHFVVFEDGHAAATTSLKEPTNRKGRKETVCQHVWSMLWQAIQTLHNPKDSINNIMTQDRNQDAILAQCFLTPLQRTLLAIMTHDLDQLQKLVVLSPSNNQQQADPSTMNTQKDVIPKNVIPLPRSIYGKVWEDPPQTFLQWAVFCRFFKGVEYLLSLTTSCGDIHREECAKEALVVMFGAPLWTFHEKKKQEQEWNENGRSVEEEIVKLLVHYAISCTTNPDSSHAPKQNTTTTTTTTTSSSSSSSTTFLTKMMQWSCVHASTWGWPHALPLLLHLGADPYSAHGVARLNEEACEGLTALHLIAACCQSQQLREGWSMIQCVLHAARQLETNCLGGNSVLDMLEARTSQGETPLRVALKRKNYSVATGLWREERVLRLQILQGKDNEDDDDDDDGVKKDEEDEGWERMAQVLAQSLQSLTQQYEEKTPYEVGEEAFDMGMAAIASCDITTLADAVRLLRQSRCSKEGNNATPRHWLGKLLLRCLDPRSPIGSCRKPPHINGVPLPTRNEHITNDEKDAPLDNAAAASDLSSVKTLTQATHLFLPPPTKAIQQEVHNDTFLWPCWEQHEVSGYTPLHMLFKHNGETVRKALLRPLCDLALACDKLEGMRKDDCQRKEEVDASGDNQTIAFSSSTSSKSCLSLACKEKFGGYTALHMACALKCSWSVSVLVKEYDVAVDVRDANGRTPWELLLRGRGKGMDVGSQLSEEVREKLMGERT